MNIDLNLYNLLVDENGAPIQEGVDAYIQNKLDETILKVPLMDIKSFFSIQVDTNVPSTSATSTGKTYIKNWNRHAIINLIYLREKYDKEFRSTTMKTEKCWQLVVRDMEEEGYITSVTQCRDKWKYLKDRYTKKKDNMSTHSSGAELFKFDFFDEMDSFLGKNASIEPIALASSMNGNKKRINHDKGECILEHSDAEEGVPAKKRKKVNGDPVAQYIEEIKKVIIEKEEKRDIRHKETLQARESARKSFEDKMDAFLQILARK